VSQDSSATHLRDKFDWGWVGVGFLLSAGGNLLAFQLVRPYVQHELLRQERVLAAAALLAGISLVIYFLGGLLVGRMARGHTAKEPAVAGVLALTVVFVYQLYFGMVNLVGLILGAPLFFGVAYGGGVLGGKWRDHVQR